MRAPDLGCRGGTLLMFRAGLPRPGVDRGHARQAQLLADMLRSPGRLLLVQAPAHLKDLIRDAQQVHAVHAAERRQGGVPVRPGLR